MTANQKYKKENPWASRLASARYRCSNPKDTKYHIYGGRGIKCLISMEEIKALWIRDGAASMQTPSIDRIDSDGNYEFSNCRFVEHRENSRRYGVRKDPWKTCVRGHPYNPKIVRGENKGCGKCGNMTTQERRRTAPSRNP